MVNWDAPDIQEWKKTAHNAQQSYCERLGDRDYDSIGADEHRYLKLKIAYSLFGGPGGHVEDSEEEVDISSYSEEQRKAIIPIYDKIVLKSGSEIQVAFIFLMIKQYDQQYQLPVIRFVQANGAEVFLDHLTRVYDSWSDFTSWNELPECLYCYPQDGWYKTNDDDQVLVEYATSPRCNVGEKIVKYADYTSTAANIGSIALLAGGFGLSFFFPPAAAVCYGTATWMGATSGVYSVGRNATKLADRASHDQSINPIDDAQARSCWLGAVGGALGVGTLGATKYVTYLAREGEVASKVMRATFNTLNVSSLTVNGIGIITNVYDLSQKDEVTVMDVANLSLSILFFANSAMNMKTARTLIKDVQRNVLDSHRTQLSDKKEAEPGFRRFAKQNRRDMRSTMYGNAKTIKYLKRIDSPNNFFADFYQASRDANKAGNVRVRVNENLLLSFNGELKMHHLKYVSMNVETRRKLIDTAGKIKSNPEMAGDYIKEVKNLCSQERIAFERTRQDTMKNLAEKFGVRHASHIEINGRKVFNNLRPHEIDRIGAVLQAKGKHATADFLKCVTKMAERNGCKTSGEFCAFSEFCFDYINNEVRKNAFEQHGRKPPISEVVNDLMRENSPEMQELLKCYKENKTFVSPLNNEASPNFASDSHATYHYFKHKMFGPKGEVSPEQYFEMIKDITGQECLKSNTLITQEGDKVVITFKNPVDGAVCVKIEPLVAVNNEGAFVATLFWDRRVMQQ